MDNFKKSLLVIVLLPILSVVRAEAAPKYASMEPLVGWSKAANQKHFFQFNPRVISSKSADVKNTVIKTESSLKINNKLIKFPTKIKYASSVRKILVGSIFSNPLKYASSWLGWLLVAGLVYDEVKNIWKKQDEIIDFPDDIKEKFKDKVAGVDYIISDGYDYDYSTSKWAWTFHHYEPACQRYGGWALYYYYSYDYVSSDVSGSCSYKVRKSATSPYEDYTFKINRIPSESCPAGSIVTRDDVCHVGIKKIEEKPITETDFDRIIAPIPIPDEIYKNYPEPLPVEAPEIDPQIVPVGDPIANPNFDPTKPIEGDNLPYIQPSVEIIPAPIPSDPWRVKLKPKNIPVPDPNKPKPDPTPDPEPNPDPDKDKNKNPDKDANKEKEPPFDLCKEHPDTLGCLKLDEVPDVDLQEKTIPITIKPDSGWGASDSVCPSPKVLYVQGGHKVIIPYDLFCMYARGLRPVILAFAWLSAALILIGIRKE